MRIRLQGSQEEVDLASEVLCVLATVGVSVSTFPSEESPEHIVRYLTLEFDRGVLGDLGVTLAPPVGR